MALGGEGCTAHGVYSCMEGRSVVCAVMSGIALEQKGGFQLNYMEGTFTFPLSLHTFIIFG